MVVKIAILRSGNIGTSPILDLLLDERADRPNIDVRVFGSGAKMNPEQVEDVVPKIDAFEPDFAIFISPNPGAPGPAKARELLSEKDVPAIIIGDAPGKGKKDEMDEQGLGYIIVMADPMIGAKREWLDPTEMAIFNADIIKVLAETGALRLVQKTIDGVIEAVDEGKEIELPKIILTAEKAVEAACFQNPYALLKGTRKLRWRTPFLHRWWCVARQGVAELLPWRGYADVSGLRPFRGYSGNLFKRSRALPFRFKRQACEAHRAQDL